MTAKKKSTQNLSLKKQKMIEALEENLGVVTTSAKKAKIDRRTHYEWMATDKEYKDAVDALNDIVLDFAEEALFERIRAGSDASTMFLLKCRGKKRGYIEKEENHIVQNIVVSDMTPEDIEAKKAKLREKFT